MALRYVPIDTQWGKLGEEMGVQDSAPVREAKARATSLAHCNPYGPSKAKYPLAAINAIKVPCFECHKDCTKARGGMRLTRQHVYCGKCYDEDKHGAESTTTHYHDQEATR